MVFFSVNRSFVFRILWERMHIGWTLVLVTGFSGIHSLLNSIDNAHKIIHVWRTSKIWHVVHFFLYCWCKSCRSNCKVMDVLLGGWLCSLGERAFEHISCHASLNCLVMLHRRKMELLSVFLLLITLSIL